MMRLWKPLVVLAAIFATIAPVYAASINNPAPSSDRHCFLAFRSGNDNNITGSGTIFTVQFSAAEVFDDGDNFLTDTFTAPVTGRYQLQSAVLLKSLTGVEDLIDIQIITSNHTYSEEMTDANDLPDRYSMSIGVVADMDAGDTATVTIQVSGNTADNVDVIGGAIGLTTRFSGCLLS